MKLDNSQVKINISPKAEYSVEFEGISKFLAYFEDVAGLTDRQIVSKGLEIANSTFGKNGSFMLERTSKDGAGSYAIIALGVDANSAHVLGKPEVTQPALRLVKI